jgi:hypothetical protein
MALIGLSRVVGIVREPLRSYSFEVELPYDFGDASRLRYQVKSVQFPVWFNLETEGVRVEGLGYYFLPIDFESREEVRIDFWEDVELSVQRYFGNWRKLIVVEDVVGTPYRELRELPSKWMKDVVVHMFDVKGRKVASYRLRKCYPVGIEVINLGYESNEVVEVSVSFVVHGIEVIT